MKKYVVRNKTTNEVLGKFDTKNQASEGLFEYIKEKNVHVADKGVVIDFDKSPF